MPVGRDKERLADALLDDHMARLYEGANSIQLDIGMDRDALVGEIWKTLRHKERLIYRLGYADFGAIGL